MVTAGITARWSAFLEASKSECYDTFQQADVDIAAYIRYYNHQRGHSYNQYLSPAAAEAA